MFNNYHEFKMHDILYYFKVRLSKIENSDTVTISPNIDDIIEIMLNILSFPINQFLEFTQIKVPFSELKVSFQEEEKTFTLNKCKKSLAKLVIRNYDYFYNNSKSIVSEIFKESYYSCIAVACLLSKYEYILNFQKLEKKIKLLIHMNKVI